MKFLRLLLAAIVLVPFASFATPGLLVQVKNGRTTMWEGITDGKGRFVTAELPPGIYSFELRVPKNIITPAQYSLVLGGARPLSDATSGEGAALRMNAEVRTPKSVRGQVTARRVTIVPAQTTGSTTSPTPAPPVRRVNAVAPPVMPPRSTTAPVVPVPRNAPAAPAAAATPGMSTFAPRPVNRQPRMINGKPHVWVPITAGSQLGRWVPAGTR